MTAQLIRNTQVGGRVVDIALVAGHIAAIGPNLRGEELLDARGGAAIPGLHDHHIHLLATAAQLASVRLDECSGPAALAQQLREADRTAAPGAWLRATGYHERCAGPLGRDALDRLVPHRPLRVQHQTGGLWMLNSAAIKALSPVDHDEPWPDGAERDPAGISTGRFFRCDTWLSARIGRQVPDLGMLGRRLAACGITGLSDASVSTDAAAAELLAAARRDGRLPVRLTLLSGGPLTAPADGAYAVGPVKLLIDDHALPDLDAMIATIGAARQQGRTVAVHCVTAGELVLTLAALRDAGALPGDRIEHGSVIPAETVPDLRALGLTVVTQPGFIDTRGDRYRALIDPAEHAELYRCASLLAAGVPVGGSSDAPYGDLDPWRGIAAAIHRRTAEGHALAPAEAIAPERALGLYLTAPEAPGGPIRQLAPAAPADLCVLRAPLEAALANPIASAVRATICAGRVTYDAG